MKRCSKCGIEKPLTEFSIRKSGRQAGQLRLPCRACSAIRSQEWREANPERYEHNKDRQSIRKKQRWQADPEYRKKIVDLNRERRQKNPESVRAYRRGYEKNRRKTDPQWAKDVASKKRERRNKNKTQYLSKCRAYYNKRIRENPEFRLRKALACRILAAVKGIGKSERTMKLVGCSIYQLREWLEAQFKPGMIWENHGEWHIDHIKPCVSFDLTDPDQQRQCFNFTNLQPLWAEEHRRKGVKFQEG